MVAVNPRNSLIMDASNILQAEFPATRRVRIVNSTVIKIYPVTT